MIESCETFEELNQREIYWIDQYQTRNPAVGYNIAVGGQGAVGHPVTEETRQKLRESTRQANLSRSPEVYQRAAETAKGNKMVSRDGICKRAHPEGFESYIQEGWSFGGLKRQVDKHGEKNPGYGKNYHAGMIWIHQGAERKYLQQEEAQPYLDAGWKRGMWDTDYRGRNERFVR